MSAQPGSPEPAEGAPQGPAAVLLEQVLASFGDAPDPRRRMLLSAAVRHLHAFAREVELSEHERTAAIRFLTATGQICSDERQEFELLSDVLGLSSLVQTAASAPGATLQTLTGPFYSANAPWRELGDSMNQWPLPGDVTAVVRGVVRDQHGNPIAGATLDVWQNATNRRYAVQEPGVQPPGNLRGRWLTDAQGRYEFITVKPVSYAIPDDGPVGELLRSSGRHPWRAAHIHFLLSADGHRPLTTEIFDAGSDFLDDDAVFGVARELIIEFTARPDGSVLGEFDFTLERSGPD